MPFSGRTNVGKSSLLNYLIGQDIAITSPVAGTTTDVVEKAMSFFRWGLFSFWIRRGLMILRSFPTLRLNKSKKIFDRADIIILVIEPEIWTNYETAVVEEAAKRKIPILAAINKIDLQKPSAAFIQRIKENASHVISLSSINSHNRDISIEALKSNLFELAPDDFIANPSLIGDLLPPGGLALSCRPHRSAST